MTKRIFIFLLLLVPTTGVLGQSGRVIPAADKTGNAAVELTLKQMFDEANGYAVVKYTEFQQKKIPYSDKLLDQTKLEQRQLAAKYAAQAGTRSDLAGDDLYYLGMLHWIAENMDGTADNLTKFAAWESAGPDRAQNARSIAVIALAKQKKMSDAERVLAEYRAKSPIKPAEMLRMSAEMAKAYKAQKDFAKMAAHADVAYSTAAKLLPTTASPAQATDETLDAGMLVFEAYRDLGERQKAEAALDDLRRLAVVSRSATFYYYAVDKKITYLMDTARKKDALALFKSTMAAIPKDFADKGWQDDLERRFLQREKHYALLGEPAPELPAIDQWFPGTQRALADYRGKVLLLDFWATWCGPCYGEFPEFKDWLREFGKDGFEILGITRYYSGEVDGVAKGRPEEVEYLKTVRAKEELPFDIVVARDQSIQLLYGATMLPTTVLIDRKGVIRYIGTGSSSIRMAEMREALEKIISEK